MIFDDVVRIGVITGAHGLDGRVKVFIISDIRDRFSKGTKILVSGERGTGVFEIVQFVEQKGRNALLRLDSVTDRDKALSLKGSSLFIDKTVAEKTRKDYLDDDSFYYYELIGCKAYINDALFGDVTEVIEAGAGNIIIIRDLSGKDIMVPFVESMVDTARIKKGRLDINPVEGLFDS
ncbi:MAG TPA: ribosome maturation factor RimM [Spirochaetota bacterium]|nr:ribosome maturation factor RimM [Spirochaetota bacterium]HPI87846.1 ribosome maturation factor RimM [Spirochaetota bacterium]HPR47422.1 ribosome maturation factor RimM [Spirochaetota bacterium]